MRIDLARAPQLPLILVGEPIELRGGGVHPVFEAGKHEIREQEMPRQDAQTLGAIPIVLRRRTFLAGLR